MHGTGANNGQTDRVIDSKISRSKNISTMYLVVKDHKKEPGKSRPIVTGNSGHTRGLSNSVSNLLESVASSIPNTFERISSEDMLSSTKEANKIMAQVKEEWRKRRLEKLRCKSCKYNAEPIIKCHICEEETCQDAHTAGGEQTGHYPSSPCHHQPHFVEDVQIKKMETT